MAGPALARYGTSTPNNVSVDTRLRHGRGTNCDCGLQHQLGAIPLTQNAAHGLGAAVACNLYFDRDRTSSAANLPLLWK
jgi:hypothetical protein